MTRIQKNDQMFALIEAYQSGNRTQKDFCSDQGINYSTFRYWLRRYRLHKGNPEKRENRLVSGGFVPIHISESDSRETFRFQIEYPGGIRISFASVPEIETIGKLLSFRMA